MTEETRKEEKIEKAQEQTEQIENPTGLQGEDLEKVSAGTYLRSRSNHFVTPRRNWVFPRPVPYWKKPAATTDRTAAFR